VSPQNLLLLSDPVFLGHVPGLGHPESPQRLSAILQRLRDEALLQQAERVTARPVRHEELLRVHRAAHIEVVEAARGRREVLDPDTYTSEESVDAAELAAGGSIELVTLACRNRSNGVALVRPPGHHATASQAMGFCLYNNVAVAAADALARGLAQRVLIVDWDVHHGNGTQDIFYGDGRVLYFSAHQFPHYPGTGHFSELGDGEGFGRTLNAPLPAGTSDGDLLLALRRLLIPAARKFRPDLVLVSAGFDGHRADPLAGWELSEAGYAMFTQEVSDLADELAGGRLVLFLEGGYDLRSLAHSVAASTRVLLGEPPALREAAPRPDTERRVAEIEAAFRAAGAL